MPLLPYKGVWPTLAPDVFVAPTAYIVGDVTIEAGANVWFSAVIRGDSAPVRIGPRTNVQDGCVIHTDAGAPCTIGADCTLGHGAIIHGATLADGVLVGMHATVLNRAVVGAGCIVAAGALVPEGKQVETGRLVMGVPGRVLREVTGAERTRTMEGVQHYLTYVAEYRKALDEAKPS